MVNEVLLTTTLSAAPTVLATDVSLAEYMDHYAALGCEWVEGIVYKMAPIGLRHENIRDYIRDVLRAYFYLNPIGKLVGEPFVMRLPAFPKRRREPDLMVILNTNTKLTETYLDGPADLCIEIVSPESVSIDHGEKFSEYEKGGVPEYWIVDALRDECRFYRLNDQKTYIRHLEDAQGVYTTPQLPNLQLHVPTLWERVLPGFYDVGEIVRKMLGK